MSILGKVTRKNLLQNRTRTVVTIIGIILSAAMFTAVTVGIVSVQDYLLRSAIWKDGNWHGKLEGLANEQREELTEDEEVAGAFFSQNVGYAYIGSGNEEKPYLYVLGADQDFWGQMPLHVTEGRLPETSEEIMVPEHLSYNGSVETKIGEKLVLELGDRMYDGEMLTQSIPFMGADEETEGEMLAVREQRTYTVVGIYERPDFEGYTAPGYTAVTCWDEKRQTELVDGYFRLKNPKDIYSYMYYQYMEENAKGNVQKYSYLTSTTNSGVLMMEGASRYNRFYLVLYSMGTIFMGLIVFGSVALIYNAFSISVSERTRQFGLFSSIGATRKQTRKMVFTEAFYVSVVGVPVGILSGIAGLAVTFYFIGDKFYSFYGIREVELRLIVTPWAVLIALAAAFLTVLISAWVPSRRAMKVSAVEAIRQSRDIRIKSREVRTPKFYYRIFGLEGVLAAKYFKRNRRKYRTTVASLFMSIVLFVSAVSFCMYLTDAVTGTFESRDYDISYSWYEGMTDTEGNPVTLAQVTNGLKNTAGVTKYSVIRSVSFGYQVPYEYLPEERQQLYTEQEYGEGYSRVNLEVVMVDKETYESYVKACGIDTKQLYEDGEIKGILMGWNTGFNREKGKVEKNLMISQDIKEMVIRIVDREKWEAAEQAPSFESLSTEEREQVLETCSYDKVLKIGGYTDSLPFGLNRSVNTFLTVVYPMEFCEQIEDDVVNGVVYFKTEDHRTAYENLVAAAEKNRLDAEALFDVYAVDEDTRNMVIVIKVLSYGFIVLIGLIAMANVFNTMTTNIMLRRREFAVLRSVGMTGKGIHKMLSLECVLYGVKSLLLGIPAAVGVTYLIFLSVGFGYDTVFYIPTGAIAVAVAVVFAEVFAGMLYAVRKVEKDNPVDMLKTENL